VEGRRLYRTVTAQDEFCTSRNAMASEFDFAVRRTGFARMFTRDAFSTAFARCAPE
jgi:hypothetical protein